MNESRPQVLTSHRRLRRLFVVGLIVAGILFTFANPARTWSDQRREINAARERNDVLEEQGRQLQARVDSLDRDAEVERLGRLEGLVRQGEEAYSILPAPGAGPPAADLPPSPEPRSWWERAREKATFWD